MSSVVVTIVDGARALLQTQSDLPNGFIRQITPERAYSISTKLEDEDLHVHVCHGDVQITAEARGVVRFLVPVTIAIRKKFEASELDPNTGFGARNEVDELIELTEQICKHMAKKTLASGAQTNGPANVVTVAPEDKFEELQQFWGIVRVDFIHFETVT